MKNLFKPKALKPDDVIGLVSPSAPLAGLVPHRTQKGIKMLNDFGFKTKIGRHALKITGYTAGSAKERAEDINFFFKDNKVKAIFSFIGGNHSNQILKYLDFELIKKNPKIFLGYSDATVLHFALYAKANLITFYGPAVLTQFAENPRVFPYTEEYFKKALMNAQPIGRIKASASWTDETLDWFKKEDLKRPRKMKRNEGWTWLKPGKAEGKILGGCITSMLHLRGTEYWPDFSDCILFWETPEGDDDFTKGEKVENIDSYLADLENSDLFKKIKGMIIAKFFGYTNEQERQLIEIVKYYTTEYKFPIVYGVDCGHTDPMITIPYGVKISINSKNNEIKFCESGVI